MNEENGSLAAGMVALNEAYLSALDAGFTEAQAMQIVVALVRESQE